MTSSSSTTAILDGRGCVTSRSGANSPRSFDIATGYFDVGALLALDGQWQGLKKIRILMGSDVVKSTKQLLLDAVRGTARRALDEGLDGEKDENPFLNGVPQSSPRCAPVRSSAASITLQSSTRRPTSPTPNSRSSVRRRS